VPLARLGVAQALLACGRVHINDVHFDFDEQVAPFAANRGPSPVAPVGQSTDEGAVPTATTEHGPEEALVLHALRVRGFVTVDGLAESLGYQPHDVLARLVDSGMVRHIEKRQMYGLLPAGKDRHAALLDTLADEAAQAGLSDHYPGFLELNDGFKQLCTEWQIRHDEPNDHSDADYDRRCVEQLTQIATAAVPVVEGFSRAVPRLARYQQRLAVAAERVANGEVKQFTGVMCESFHDVWMELHEDLIVLQRIDRTEEGSF
jgi:hypothetical protein